MSGRRLFTLEEATALLPRLKHELELIRESLVVLRRQSSSLPPGARVDDGSSPLNAAALAQLQAAERRLVEWGVELKDTEQGLFDFPAIMGDRVIFLCWKEEEAEIAWYHDLTAGLAGRQPLPARTVEIDRAEDAEGPESGA